MASRYTSIRPVDYCFNPIHVVDDDKDIIVPCGKCDGCLLHKANEWSMRCGMEIEDSAATVFGTLTYTNKYLPKLFPTRCDLPNFASPYVWISDHSMNVRFNSVRDVPREDGIIISQIKYDSLPIERWDNIRYPSIAYASKRDIQLWLKSVRKDLSFKNYGNEQKRLFRYYIISEIGPTTGRPHFHFLLFCWSVEVAQYLLEYSLYQNWKMCLPDRFFRYAHLCDSGARGYVTQYLTCYSNLPSVYRENKEIKPFRLASKSPAIGFVGFSKEKVFQDVSRGVIKYTREITRLESNSLLSYPSGFTSSLFPKCYRFDKMDDSRRFSVYCYLYRAVRKNGEFIDFVLSRLREELHVSDYLATCACYRFCCEFVDSPEYYYYLLDEYYYQVAQERLRSFYRSQEVCDFYSNPFMIFEFYSNLELIFLDEKYYIDFRALAFLRNYGFEPFDLVGNRDFFSHLKYSGDKVVYRNEVRDIVFNMEKMPKFNEMIGQAPTNF